MVNQLSFLIFSMVLDNCGYEEPCVNLAMESRAYELIYINNSQRIPFRSYLDYLKTKYDGK